MSVKVVHYDVWDTDINKYLGRFEDDAEAFALVRTLVDRYGAECVDSLAVGRASDDGTILLPITGDELLRRIGHYRTIHLDPAPAQPPTPERTE